MKEEELPKLSRNPITYFVLPVFFIIGLAVVVKKIYDHRQVEQHGVKTYAIVTNRYISTRNRSSDDVTVTYACTGPACNSDKYLSHVDNTEERYAIGDTLIILYSKEHPTIVEAIGIRVKGVDHYNDK